MWTVFVHEISRPINPASLSFQRDYGASATAADAAPARTDHVYRLPKYVSSSSGLGSGSGNFSRLAECKDEEDASRKKEVDDLISKYAPKNVDKQLQQVSDRRRLPVNHLKK